MALREDFERIVGTLPGDWTDLNLDLRIIDPEDYVDAAVLLAQINAQPYSRSKWHWRLRIANGFGHAAAPETVAGVLGRLDSESIDGVLEVRDAQEGRAEVVETWGRPESVRKELRDRRNF